MPSLAYIGAKLSAIVIDPRIQIVNHLRPYSVYLVFIVAEWNTCLSVIRFLAPLANDLVFSEHVLNRCSIREGGYGAHSSVVRAAGS